MLNEEELMSKGLKLLFDELGPVDAIRFIHMCDGVCSGNYTEERRDMNLDMNELERFSQATKGDNE